MGQRQTIADFDLSHPVVQAKLTERYGDGIPLEEPMVSPAAIFDAPELVKVFED